MPFNHILRDPVVIVLLCASLVSWVIIIDRLLSLHRARRSEQILAGLRQVIEANASVGRDHLLILLDAAIAAQKQRLEGLLPVLGVIGSTAPYIGLLGTVIGIIQAFAAIQAHNVMSPSIVAGGIATALVATAAGLAVAIPAVAAHHLLTNAIQRQVASWEATVAGWLPTEEQHEPLTLA
jgi:biopolymer transport protein ExbB